MTEMSVNICQEDLAIFLVCGRIRITCIILGLQVAKFKSYNIMKDFYLVSEQII